MGEGTDKYKDPETTGWKGAAGLQIKGVKKLTKNVMFFTLCWEFEVHFQLGSDLSYFVQKDLPSSGVKGDLESLRVIRSY